MRRVSTRSRALLWCGLWVLAGMLAHPPGAVSHAQTVTATQAGQAQLVALCAQTVVGGGPPDITIPDDGNVYEINGSTTCGLITVEGTLKCADSVTAHVKADGILVTGRNARLECGTATNRFDGDVTFTIQNDRSFPGLNHGERAIVVKNGGTLSLHGLTDKAGFTRITQDVKVDDDMVDVIDASGWEKGDSVIVTTTSTYPTQTELVTLDDDCPSNSCRIGGRFAHVHYGAGTQTYAGAGEGGNDLTVDLRAYAANLRRNITIRGADDTYWGGTNPKGAHMMIMPSATAQIDAVELVRMGQETILGRYPIHFHHAGSVAGQYVRNSSIHDSASRCVALHNTHKAEVTDNVCYNVQGHALFLENGNEVKNTIRGNLLVDVVAPPAGTELLQSDVDIQISRWRGPAGIWVANPDNTIQDNVVVNAGTGFWHAFIAKLKCYDKPNQVGPNPLGGYCDYVPPSGNDYNVQPVRTPTLDPDLYEGAYYPDAATGDLYLMLKGYTPTSGSPNQYQPRGEGKFDLVCP